VAGIEVLRVKAIKAVVFWLIMVLAGVVLWQTIRRQPSRWIPEGLGIVAFVLFTGWFRGRFSGARRRFASIMLYSGLFAIFAGLMAGLQFQLVGIGYEPRKSLAEAVMFTIGFVTCASLSLWSFLRLRESAPT
jgi:hypothetical protein